jgi:hypothetical protein
MKMRPKTGALTSGKLSVRLVAIAPSSDFVWNTAPETTLGTFCAKPIPGFDCKVPLGHCEVPLLPELGSALRFQKYASP